jgi:two-component system, NarL family, response regulator DesR
MSRSSTTLHRGTVRARPRWRHQLPRQIDLADPINVLIVDNDAAVRVSLEHALSAELGIGKVDSAPSSGIAVKRVLARRPHVCLIDYHVGSDAGFLLTRHMKRLDDPPDVIVYGADLDAAIAGAARVAGADGLIVSPPSTHELAQIIRRVAGGEKQVQTVPPAAVGALAARLDPCDRPIMTMLVRDTPAAEVAAVLGLSREQLSTRRWAILDRLRRRLVEPIRMRDGSAHGDRTTALSGERLATPCLG